MATVNAGLGRFSATTVALTLAALTLFIALLTPEPVGRAEGGLSTFSTAPGGAGIVHELASRFGWRTEQRTATLDALRAQGDTQPNVQVVLAPNEELGAHEIHDLLENVRHGGGLVFSVDGGNSDGNEGLADSIGVTVGGRGQFYTLVNTPIAPDTELTTDTACVRPRRSRTVADALAIPPEVRELTWSRHAPGRVEELVGAGRDGSNDITAGLGFPMGKGHVAVIGGSAVFSNAAVKVCRFGADLAVMRLLEYVRPAAAKPPVLVFDEYHHGFGEHGGTVAAATTYLRRVPSGRFLAQALIAGVLLLLALAPRPLVPRDDTHVVRRSPLEHAAALGRAYEDVGATRTATSDLVAGLRRRTRGIVAVPASADDDVFLAAVAQRIPSLASRVDVVKRARTNDTAKRDFAEVGQALAAIEQQLQTTPSSRS